MLVVELETSVHVDISKVSAVTELKLVYHLGWLLAKLMTVTHCHFNAQTSVYTRKTS